MNQESVAGKFKYVLPANFNPKNSDSLRLLPAGMANRGLIVFMVVLVAYMAIGGSTAGKKPV